MRCTSGPWLSTRQKVNNFKPEHFGQFGKVLWAWVAASGFPGLDVATVDAENVANGLQSKSACLAGGFDAGADHVVLHAPRWARRVG